MSQDPKQYKGQHPGVVLEKILREKGIRKRHLALTIQEFPQTISSITRGTRGMNTSLSIKLEEALELEEGFFMTLQVFYDIKLVRETLSSTPDLKKLRKVLFWDTDMSKIDWHKQSKAVIQRVFERGNPHEQAEIIRFYGNERVNEVRKKLKIIP
jgi:addiction module HigA family antidote